MWLALYHVFFCSGTVRLVLDRVATRLPAALLLLRVINAYVACAVIVTLIRCLLWRSLVTVLYMLQYYFGMWCRVFRWIFIGFSEEIAASIFKDKEWANQSANGAAPERLLLPGSCLAHSSTLKMETVRSSIFPLLPDYTSLHLRSQCSSNVLLFSSDTDILKCSSMKDVIFSMQYEVCISSYRFRSCLLWYVPKHQ
jgi:hypothetical protein